MCNNLRIFAHQQLSRTARDGRIEVQPAQSPDARASPRCNRILTIASQIVPYNRA